MAACWRLQPGNRPSAGQVMVDLQKQGFDVFMSIMGPDSHGGVEESIQYLINSYIFSGPAQKVHNSALELRPNATSGKYRL
jgi:hypothetical protein